MKWFIKGFRNYVNFKGRARRMEYWNFCLFAFIFSLVLRFVDAVLFWNVEAGNPAVFSSLFALFIFLPNLAVSVRRLHDTGRSGKKLMWYCIAVAAWVMLSISCFVLFLRGSKPVFLSVIMFLGSLGILVWSIIFFVWFLQPGTPGLNKYGPDPKAVEE